VGDQVSIFLLNLYVENSHPHPALFVHIPKTGGTSVRDNPRVEQVNESGWLHTPPWMKMGNERAIYDAGGSLRPFEDFPPEWHYPSFAFVRDPWDRLVSCWKDFRYQRPAWPAAEMDYACFVLWAGQCLVDVPIHGQLTVERLIGDPTSVLHHCAPQTHPAHGLQHAKFIGRYETLETDLDRFCDENGLPRITPLPRHRDSSAHPSPERTPELERLVREMYAEDYKMLEHLP
jgi:hypothetical protein